MNQDGERSGGADGSDQPGQDDHKSQSSINGCSSLSEVSADSSFPRGEGCVDAWAIKFGRRGCHPRRQGGADPKVMPNRCQSDTKMILK